MFNKRNRMVSIRLSDEEFTRLLKVCEETGARSLSDLARDAMQRLVNGQSGRTDEHQVKQRLEELASKLTHLQREVDRLTTLVAEESE